MSLVGERFGRWFIESIGEPYIFPSKNSTKVRYNCLCDCGNSRLVREDTLLNGDSTSCGCFAKEKARERATIHGMSNHPLFQIWYDMLRRCYDTKRKDFVHYGGRGISVCENWKDKEIGMKKFVEDMYDSYKENLELDRIDVNGGYCKENCKWATRQEQVINRRHMGSSFDAKFITYDGETLCISQWAERVGLPYKVLVDHLGKLKWSVERALTTPKM